jgi:uncharacterized membrane protein YkvA (DUF1232 family)
MAFIQKLKEQSRELKTWVFTLYLACRDPRTPWYARVTAGCVVAYAFSPIDLIPDFIPILGYVDDLILVPLGIALTMRMIPRPILDEHRERATVMKAENRTANWIAAGVIIVIWALLAGASIIGLRRAFFT